jgi:hypothetical protein
MRARIALRKFGLLSADAKETRDLLVSQEMEKIKQGKGRDLSEEDIIDAFSRGDEVRLPFF